MNAPDWISAIVALIGMPLLVYQLRQAAHALKLTANANRTSDLMAVLSLEGALAEARSALEDAALSVARISKAETDPNQKGEGLRFAELHYESKKEQYLNAADRLCACIVRGYVSEPEYRKDYRNWIIEIVKQHEDRLGPSTRHANILKVHRAWSEDRSAIEPGHLSLGPGRRD